MQAQGNSAKGGDPGAEAGQRLAAQERRLRLLLAHLAGRAVRARVELEDLVQEVFLRALASPHGLPEPADDEGPLWRVLTVVARQVVIDVARALRAHKRAGTPAPLARSEWSRAPAVASTREAGPSTLAAGAETSRALARAFLELAPEHRRVLGLRQFAGLSARETAARMGRSETAVHSLYRRALGAWQEALDRKRSARDESGGALRLEGP